MVKTWWGIRSFGGGWSQENFLTLYSNLYKGNESGTKVAMNLGNLFTGSEWQNNYYLKQLQISIYSRISTIQQYFCRKARQAVPNRVK